MRNSIRGRLGRRLGGGVLALALAASLTSCGLQSASGFVPEVGPGTIKPMPALDGVKVRVGSKDFTEQQVLGKIATIALAAAGADVDDRTNMAGSVTVRQALERRQIDLYWEYTGTGWVTYLREQGGSAESQKMWQQVSTVDAERNDISWLPAAPLNNSYGMAMPRDTAEELGVSKLSDIEKMPEKDRTFCTNAEFYSRDDGFQPMMKAYGLPVERDKVRTMNEGVIYESMAKGSPCKIGMVTTSDGRIKTLDLVVLEDDKGYFPKYNAAVTVDGSVMREHPEIRDVFDEVSKKLTTDTMRNLNGRVDTEGEDPVDVALDWLASEGLVQRPS